MKDFLQSRCEITVQHFFSQWENFKQRRWRTHIGGKFWNATCLQLILLELQEKKAT